MLEINQDTVNDYTIEMYSVATEFLFIYGLGVVILLTSG